MNNLIYKTTNFTVERHPKPFVSRNDGGHLRIFPKERDKISNRTDLNPSEAIEFMRLSMVVGRSLSEVMNEQGVPVVKINYEDLGNWAFKRNERPVFHLHIFGRAENAKDQVFPEAVKLPDRSTGFYDKFKPLTDKDIRLIGERIKEIFDEEKYNDEEWGFV